MPDHLSEQQLAGIRADLAAVPAPPWRWIGVRHAGGPQLVTDHSGRQYILRAAKPADQNGDELTDPVTDYPVYGDLQFRDQRPDEEYATMRRGNELAVGRTSYDPDSIAGVNNPVARWIEKSAAHAAALLAEVDRLDAGLSGFALTASNLLTELEAAQARIAELEKAPAVAFRASYDDDIPLGTYRTITDATSHGDAHYRQHHDQDDVMLLAWYPEAGSDDEVWRLWVTDHGDDDQPTSYVVTQIEISANYEDGDE
jgi:hypothetical protein